VWVDALGERIDVQGFNMRQYLQRLATDGLRNHVHENFFVNLVLPVGFKHELRVCVVTDVRFEIEVDRIKQLGGTTVLINRDTATKHSDHLSEQSYQSPLWDYQINNNGTMEELRLAIDLLLKEIEEYGGVKRLHLTDKQKSFEVPEISPVEKQMLH